MQEYQKIVKRAYRRSGRARDFFDISIILKSRKFNIELTSQENVDLLQLIFKAYPTILKFLCCIKKNNYFRYKITS